MTRSLLTLDEGADVVVVVIADPDKARAFEDLFFMYGPGDPDLDYGAE